MKKKLMSLLMVSLLLMVGIGITGCGKADVPEDVPAPAKEEVPAQTEAPVETETKDDGWVIGYICKDLSQDVFQEISSLVEKKLLEGGASEMIKLDCEMDPEKCLNNLDNLIAQNVDIIMICTPDQELSQTIVDRCNAANIPVFADSDGLIVNGKHIAPALELDAYTVGYDLGEWLAEYVNTEMDLAADADTIGYMRMTMNEVSSCVPRGVGAKDAFLEGVPEFDEAKVIDANYDGTTEKAYDVAVATIAAHPEITKWVCTAPNDEGAAGATRALEAASLDQDACVVGAGGYLAKDEFKKDYSCFKASSYFSYEEAADPIATAIIEYLRDGKEIFSEYKGAIEGDDEFGIFFTRGILVDKNNYVEIMGPDAE